MFVATAVLIVTYNERIFRTGHESYHLSPRQTPKYLAIFVRMTMFKGSWKNLFGTLVFFMKEKATNIEINRDICG